MSTLLQFRRCSSFLCVRFRSWLFGHRSWRQDLKWKRSLLIRTRNDAVWMKIVNLSHNEPFISWLLNEGLCPYGYVAVTLLTVFADPDRWSSKIPPLSCSMWEESLSQSSASAASSQSGMLQSHDVAVTLTYWLNGRAYLAKEILVTIQGAVIIPTKSSYMQVNGQYFHS